MNEPPHHEQGPGQAGGEAVNEELTPAMRLLALQRQHRALDEKINELYSYPYRNQILLQRLKKQKLRLKDTIERLKDDMIPDLNA
jgi:hypothetical protein